MRRFITLAIVLALALAACGDDGTAKAPAADPVTTPAYLAFRGQPTACGAEQPPSAVELQWDAPGEAGVSGSLSVTINTSCGPIQVTLDADAAPETVNSFVFLAEQSYFDGTTIHRAFPGFMVQMGDPTATGRGNPGYSIPDEFPGSGFAYERGVVAMANSGQPDSGGSQFFLMLDTSPLPPAYSVFGTVTAGMEVLDRIVTVPMGPGNDPVPTRPLESIYIETVDISR